MFQALATLLLSLLLLTSTATATANANADTDAAAQLQAELGSSSSAAAAPTFGSKQLTRCRQSCYQQFARDWHYCTDFVDCRNCWQNCQRQLAPFELRVHHAQRQGALVLTDIGWDELIANASRQCLITWEVSGGGLMGNLLTDTARAELSLWPDTVYNIQVTCKHKLTGLMRRSLKLNVDTHQLLLLQPDGTSTWWTNKRRTIASRLQPVSMSATSKTTSKAAGAGTLAGAGGAATTGAPGHVLVHPTDRVYIISSLPTASQLSGVVYPAFGALAFFLALLVMFLFLRPQRKRATTDDASASDTASLLSAARRGSRLSTTLDNSTLHV